MQPLTRREFIRRLGLAAAGLALMRCGLPRPAAKTDRERVREAWFGLDELNRELQEGRPRRTDEQIRQIVEDHQAALAKVASAGELSAPAAELVQEAFATAVYHLWRMYGGMTCYEATMGPDYGPASAGEFLQQAAILEEYAAGDLIDAATLDQARNALAHDLAFLALSSDEVDALYAKIMEDAGGSYNYPAFAALELEVTPEAAEATEFLVALLASP
jgi:hypothetical protein